MVILGGGAASHQQGTPVYVPRVLVPRAPAGCNAADKKNATLGGCVQGYLVHKKTPPPLGPNSRGMPKHAVSYERGTLVLKDGLF